MYICTCVYIISFNVNRHGFALGQTSMEFERRSLIAQDPLKRAIVRFTASLAQHY